MRILIAGNLANTGFELTLALRKKGIDSFLLMPLNPKESEDPKLLYPDLREKGYPDWIRWFDKKKRKISTNDWKFQIIKEMRKREYNIIIALTEFPIFALFSGKPFIVISTGSDMRELPFEKSVKGILYKLALKRAKVILWSEPDKTSILKKLKVLKKSIQLGIPRNANFHPEKIDNEKFFGKFIIFHPTRQDWIHKGNDKFLRAFNRLCEIRDDVFLIMSKEGPDIDKSLEIISKNKDKIQLIPKADFKELQYYYNLSDVVIDQFKVGSFGMIAIESMMCKKPIITEIKAELYKENNVEIPQGIINASNEDTIVKEIIHLAEDNEYKNELGEKNYQYMISKRNTDQMTNQYISICKKILGII